MKLGRLGWLAWAMVAMSCANDSDGDIVRVEQTDRMGFSTGQPTTVPLATPYVASASLTYDDRGTPKTVEGTLEADGTVTFRGVPRKSYMLEIRRPVPEQYPDDPPVISRLFIDGDRRVGLGRDFWGRHDAERLDDATTLTFTLDDATGFSDGDSIDIVSLGSFLQRGLNLDSTSTTQTNPPADGATSASGWVVPASDLVVGFGPEASGLPSAAYGDVLTLIHSRYEVRALSTDMRDPYRTLQLYRALSTLHIPNAMMTNGVSNAISGTMTELPVTPLALDFRGSTFAAIRQQAGYVDAITSSMSVCRVHEAGTGPGYYVSVAPVSFCVSAFSRKAAANPTCYPDSGGACDSMLCPSGCDTSLSTSNRDPGDLSATLDVPRIYETGMRDVLTTSYSFSRTWSHPVTGGKAFMFAKADATTLASSITGPITLGLEPPVDVRLDGMALPHDQNTTVASSTPTLTFSASPGAELYFIELLELRPDAGTSVSVERAIRGAATILTASTTVEIPPNVLRSGHYYYFRIQARKDGTDPADNFRFGSDSILRTAIMSGVFTL